MNNTTLTPSRVVCAGEAMIELSIDRAEPARAGVGIAGDTLNTAVYLKRELQSRGNASSVAYATCMGQDAFTDRFLALLAEEGIDDTLVGRHPERLPGLYSISTDDAGERSFSYWRDRSAARCLFQPDLPPALDDLASADLLYLSAITLAILPEAVRSALFDWIERWREAPGHRFAFDSNWRPRLWSSVEQARATTERAWRLSDIALPSVDDEMALFGDADEGAVMTRLRGWGVSDGALKRGEAGPLGFADEHLEVRFEPAATVVDSTAAGDSFNGAYLASRVAGESGVQALEHGHRCAAHVVGHRGAIVAR